jgi:hypothetical protein
MAGIFLLGGVQGAPAGRALQRWCQWLCRVHPRTLAPGWRAGVAKCGSGLAICKGSAPRDRGWPTASASRVRRRRRSRQKKRNYTVTAQNVHPEPTEVSMNKSGFSRPDEARSRLRSLVAAVDGEITRLTLPITNADGSSLPNDLRTSWDLLTEQLALGPEPEVRECPVCHHIGMRAARVCGYCWSPLTPPTESADRPAGA